MLGEMLMLPSVADVSDESTVATKEYRFFFFFLIITVLLSCREGRFNQLSSFQKQRYIRFRFTLSSKDLLNELIKFYHVLFLLFIDFLVLLLIFLFFFLF